MENLLKEGRFDFVADRDKQFVLVFDNEMTQLGYDYSGKIGSGYCWGKFMIIYTKSGIKSRKVFARIYMREDGIILRFFFSGIDNHRQYIENSPSHIKEVFVGEHANCKHCHNEKNGLANSEKHTHSIVG